MGGFIAQRLVKLLIAAERPVKGARVGILGLTFKEDVPDLRNSRVPDIVAELREFGIAAMVDDPLADPAEAQHEYGIELVPARDFDRTRRAGPGGAAPGPRRSRLEQRRKGLSPGGVSSTSNRP